MTRNTAFRSLAILAGLGCAGISLHSIEADAATASHPGVRTGAVVERLAWMAGCWEGALGGGTLYEEVWMAPRGGTLVGMSRTTRAGATVGWEWLRIEDDQGTPVYVAAPAGQQPTRFRVTEVGPASVTFENLEHDFPQRILYSQPSPTALLARIEGMNNGQLRGIDFPLERVECSG